MKDRDITVTSVIATLAARITRTQAPERTLCLLYPNGEHLFIRTHLGRKDAEDRIPYGNGGAPVQVAFTSAILPSAYYKLVI